MFVIIQKMMSPAVVHINIETLIILNYEFPSYGVTSQFLIYELLS